MAHNVAFNDQLVAWDKAFVVTANQQLGDTELIFFTGVTHLAGRAASILVGLGLGIYFIVKRKYRWLAVWAGGLIGNSILIQILKQTFQRPRPDMFNPFIDEVNFSFPSGHAAGSVMLYGLLAYVLFRHLPKLSSKQQFLLVSGVLWLGIFIGTSRLALGVHYPSDVLTGWLVACCWLTIVISVDILVNRFSTRRANARRSTEDKSPAE
jgi:undecaprenyl-diphosphatase